MNRLQYYRRIFRAYAGLSTSHLTFWHDTPQANLNAAGSHELGEYYMSFPAKADYSGQYDSAGVPMLNYHGKIGLQYNPIAIAQWGLGNYNLYRQTGNDERRKKFLIAADWLCSHLELNSHRTWTWNHYFDWEYRSRLAAPWYSALAQGQGISLLVRTHRATGRAEYLEAAERAFAAFLKSTDDGGVTFRDDKDNLWFEEYIVSPPTHILNGFIWASWGVYDYFLGTQDAAARDLFLQAMRALCANLHRYDLGYWSLYEQSRTLLPMVASPFYHRLHVVQLRVMHRLTGDATFAHYADKWEAYTHSRTNRARALCYKSAFKLCFY